MLLFLSATTTQKPANQAGRWSYSRYKLSGLSHCRHMVLALVVALKAMLPRWPILQEVKNGARRCSIVSSNNYHCWATPSSKTLHERFIQLLKAEVEGEQPPPSMAEHLQWLERWLSDEEHALLVYRTWGGSQAPLTLAPETSMTVTRALAFTPTETHVP